MSAQHTPGPWHVSNDGWVAASDYQTVCEMYATIEEKQYQANARLIAAAPDLLEALQNAVGVLQAFATQSQTAELIERECRAAIDKAQGARNEQR